MPELTLAMFQSCLHQAFSLKAGEQTLPLTLVEATATGDQSRRERTFSLIFLGPLQPILPQKIYALTNSDIGTHEIFLVPIGQTSAGTQYQAIFN